MTSIIVEKNVSFIQRVYDIIIFPKNYYSVILCMFCSMLQFTRVHGRGSCMLLGSVADFGQRGIACSIMALLCSDTWLFVAVVFACVLRLINCIIEGALHYQNKSKH